MNNIQDLKPFKRLCVTIGNLPTAYIESMSYYECLTYLVKYLTNDVIPAVNNNTEAIKELQDYVVHYFDNLDVQEEINNKLNEMAEDGTFDEICNRYFGDGEPVPVTSAKLDSSKDQLVVATNAAFEPFEYMKGESYYGIDMELAALLAEKLGQELVIMNMDFDAVCLSVGQQKCDIAMAGLTVSESLEAAKMLEADGINAQVINIHTI